MKVNSTAGGVSMQAAQMGPQQEDDLVSRNIKRQIEDLQKQLQELSSDTQMSGEQRMKKRQELQKQISDLDVQLRQHQIEQRRQKQHEKASTDNVKGLSQGSMEAMISADISMKQAAEQGSVASKMKGRAGVLEVEIKLDSARNGDTSAKQEELAKAEQKAENAMSSQISTLDKANKAMKEASDSDKDTKESGTSKNGEKETEDIENKENIENAEDKRKQEGSLYNTRVDVRI